MSTVLVCPRCAKVWPYSGDATRATCPDCKGKVPTDRYAVSDIDDILTQLRSRIEEIEDDAHDGRKARDQLEGRGSKQSLKAKVFELIEHVESLEERIEDLEADDGFSNGIEFDDE